jgi:hypothetical protein
MQSVSKTAQTLRFFAQQYGSPGISRKQLVKLVYMADVLGREYLGHPITAFTYKSDLYGPNVVDIDDPVEELRGQALAEQYTSYDRNIKRIRLRASHVPMVFDFTLGENEILRYVVENYMPMPLDEFIDDVVKETAAYKAAERIGDEIPMAIADGTKRDEIGFDLEHILNAEKQAAEGNSMTLGEFFDELRTEITTRHSA